MEFLDPPYRKIVDGGDWLWWDGERWQASGTVWGGWVDRPDVAPERCKRGLGIPDEAWEKVRQAMLSDRNWPDGN